MKPILIGWFESLPGPLQYKLLSLMWRHGGLTPEDIDAIRAEYPNKLPKQEDL
jgi:hypothetical protein